MKQTVNLQDFRDAFYKMGRKDHFSYEGLEILFNYIEELDQDTGEETGLDVIALCDNFAESTIDDLIRDFDIDISDCEPADAEAIEETVLEYMKQHTSIRYLTPAGTIVYSLF